MRFKHILLTKHYIEFISNGSSFINSSDLHVILYNIDRLYYHYRMIDQLVKPINKRNLKYYE